jgi:uncharacterized membrane protein YtjA (UPF0391 family)
LTPSGEGERILFQYAMLSLLVALVTGFVAFAGLAGAANLYTKVLFGVSIAAFVACMISEATRRT